MFVAENAPGVPREAENLSPRLEKIRDAHRIPALAAAAVDEGEIVAIGATGSRRAGAGDSVFVDDIWHLGSCTKSMTASVCAMLVEDGKLRWDSTPGENTCFVAACNRDGPEADAACDEAIRMMINRF